MRVAIDARLLAYQGAGTSTYIRGVLSGLHELTDAPDVLVVASRKTPIDKTLLGFRRTTCWTPCHHRLERWTLGFELAPMSVDVLHSPDFIPPRRFGRRWATVITVHDLAFLKWPELVTPDARRYYGQIFAATRRADRIIAVSEATRNDLIDLVSESIEQKIAVIPEGVDPSFRPIDRHQATVLVRSRFGLRQPFFLYVGTIEPRKNIPTLLRAFARFAQNRNDEPVDLVLAGARGWLDDDVNAVAKTLRAPIHFLGRVSGDELVALYNASLALVLVSLDEGFGLPAVEAMACGIPVVASRVGALPGVVQDGGIFVDPRDGDEIAEQLRLVADDPLLRQDLGARGLRRARAYQWKEVAARTARVYREAAACAS